MNELELYLFDLQGFSVVPDALDQIQLRELNHLLDEHIESECSTDMTTYRFWNLLDWGQEFLDVIDNHRITPYLEGVFGKSFRLDHLYLDVIRVGEGPIGANLHGGPVPFHPAQFFEFRDGRMHNGLSVVGYNLMDVGSGDGGFGCIPGSHKSNYRFPDEWRDMHESNEFVKNLVGPAGTAVVFTEALVHGTLPWTGLHERRTLFLKYSPLSIAWSDNYFDPDNYDGITEGQKEILRPPTVDIGSRYKK